MVDGGAPGRLHNTAIAQASVSVHFINLSKMLALRSISRTVQKMAASNALLSVSGVSRTFATSDKEGSRVESDTMGKINVANAVYWGAQTQRSLENFKIGGPQARMPLEIIRGE
jgi:hypothetical protein